MAKAKPKKHIVRNILLALLVVIVLGVAACMVVNTLTTTKLMTYAKNFSPIAYSDQLKPERDRQTGCVTFVTDDDFRVLQISDIHLGGGFLSYQKDLKALTCVASMIAAEKPDLVIFTGDQAFPIPHIAGTLNNIRPVHALCSMMEKLGVYWTICFGNHDTEVFSLANRAKISSIYGDRTLYPHCLFETGPEEVDGYGNYAINVKNTQGIITNTFYVLDSHAYTGTDYFGIFLRYDNIHQNQIDWYKAQIEKMNAANRQTIAELNMTETQAAELTRQYGMVKSLLFFHIPLKEYRTAFREYADNGYQDTADVKLIYGSVGEEGEIIYCSEKEDELFETVLAEGSTQGIFCGHDHYNNFSLEYKGIRLTYCGSVDYLAYRDIEQIGSQRGCTTIITHSDGTFDNAKENYYQPKYESSMNEKVTMQRLNPNMEN